MRIYNDLAFLYNRIFSRKDYAGEVNFIMKITCPKNGNVLDFGCGTGNHLAEFSKRGYECIGIESSKKMIEIVKETYPNLKILQKDMITYKLTSNFRIIYSLGTTVSYFTDFEIAKLIPLIYSHLESNGYFIFDLWKWKGCNSGSDQ